MNSFFAPESSFAINHTWVALTAITRTNSGIPGAQHVICDHLAGVVSVRDAVFIRNNWNVNFLKNARWLSVFLQRSPASDETDFSNIQLICRTSTGMVLKHEFSHVAWTPSQPLTLRRKWFHTLALRWITEVRRKQQENKSFHQTKLNYSAWHQSCVRCTATTDCGETKARRRQCEVIM